MNLFHGFRIFELRRGEICDGRTTISSIVTIRWIIAKKPLVGLQLRFWSHRTRNFLSKFRRKGLMFTYHIQNHFASEAFFLLSRQNFSFCCLSATRVDGRFEWVLCKVLFLYCYFFMNYKVYTTSNVPVWFLSFVRCPITIIQFIHITWIWYYWIDYIIHTNGQFSQMDYLIFVQLVTVMLIQ